MLRLEKKELIAFTVPSVSVQSLVDLCQQYLNLVNMYSGNNFYTSGSLDICKQKLVAKLILTLKFQVKFFFYCFVFKGTVVRNSAVLCEKNLKVSLVFQLALYMCLHFTVRCRENSIQCRTQISQNHHCTRISQDCAQNKLA